jgi:hypothetical protein
MKKIQIAAFVSLIAALFVILSAGAQSTDLTLKMSRDWGYGGFHGDIQGLFTMKVTGPADLAKVSFYIDDTVIGEATKAPFNLQFNTDNYPLGVHKLYAVGTSTGGWEYRSNVINAEFVPASSASKTVFPILAVVLGAVVISALIPLALNRKVKNLPMGAERNYGAAGGAICPRCHRPYPLSFFTPHFGFTKLGVCPYCRKVSLVRPESIVKLREAEKAELGGDQVAVPEESEAEKLKKELDNSKYQGF